MKKIFNIIVLTLLVSLTAFGNNFPRRNVNLIVPYSAGGGTDQVARAIASAAQEELGRPVTVVNRTGAGGAVGHTAGARSRASIRETSRKSPTQQPRRDEGQQASGETGRPDGVQPPPASLCPRVEGRRPYRSGPLTAGPAYFSLNPR